MKSNLLGDKDAGAGRVDDLGVHRTVLLMRGGSESCRGSPVGTVAGSAHDQGIGSRSGGLAAAIIAVLGRIIGSSDGLGERSRASIREILLDLERGTLHRRGGEDVTAGLVAHLERGRPAKIIQVSEDANFAHGDDDLRLKRRLTRSPCPCRQSRRLKSCSCDRIPR